LCSVAAKQGGDEGAFTGCIEWLIACLKRLGACQLRAHLLLNWQLGKAREGRML